MPAQRRLLNRALALILAASACRLASRGGAGSAFVPSASTGAAPARAAADRTVAERNVGLRAVLERRKPIASPVIEQSRGQLHKPADEDAWRISDDVAGATVVSDAQLLQQQQKDGTEWTVKAPITFSYKVRESVDILDPSSPDLLFGFLDGDVEGLTRALSRAVKRVVVVDDNVFAIYGDKIKAYLEHHNVEHRLLVLPTNEEHKNMDMVLKIAEAIHDLGIDRRLDPVIAIGGGVCMDIVGFAASMYRRRTPYIRVPTTVMGYVDASIGAKTGVNFVGRKNKLGAYIPPVLTLLDRSFLGTLDQRQLSNGAAEILKMALVKDGELYELLANHGEQLIDGKFQDAESGGSVASARVLNLAIQTMLEELAPNLWEDSLERLVDFGHVFSMELEMSVLHDEKLFHGEAVAIDMVFSSVLAHVRGHISMPYLESIIATARGLKLPVYHERMDSAQLASSLKDRIKFSQGQKIPLPTGHGVARLFNDITQEQMDEALVLWKQLCA
jgi:3-dehydroquinate synthase